MCASNKRPATTQKRCTSSELFPSYNSPISPHRKLNLPILPFFFTFILLAIGFLLCISIPFNVKCLCNCSWCASSYTRQEWEEGLAWDDYTLPIQSTRVLRDDVRERVTYRLTLRPSVDVYKNCVVSCNAPFCCY